jgi:aspartate/methionine/tyrosine aminotransferase
MNFQRMIMEVESPEEIGYDKVVVNLAESSMRDRSLTELGVDLHSVANSPLCYGDHRGSEALRQAIAADGNGHLTADDVLVTVGAAGALFLVATALLDPGDELVVTRPNYASNLETPRAIGATIAYLDLTFESGYQIDVDALAHAVTPRTKLVSITTPHNPTGAVIPPADLLRIVHLTRDAGCVLLVDETYRELADTPLPPASTLGDHVISVSSLSKTYGVPGIRIGWLTCTNRALMTTLLAGQEQAALTHSVLDIAVAEHVMPCRDALLPDIRAHVHTNRRIVADWIASDPGLEWVPPEGGVVCFPRFTTPALDARALYAQLQSDGYFIGPGWWLEQDARSFRLGYGFPTATELQSALTHISSTWPKFIR